MLDKLMVKGTENYKCYDILKDLYANNPEFKKIISEHKKDKNYTENYYAAQGGYKYFKNN